MKKNKNIFPNNNNQGSAFKHFRWEALLVPVAVIIYLYPFSNMLRDYKNQKNALMGDWFNSHPNEWILQSEKINDSTLDRRVLKSYFSLNGSYSEINDTGFVFNAINYNLDEKKNTLDFYYKNDSVAHLKYRIYNDTLLEIQKIIDSAQNIKLTQFFKRRIVNPRR